MIKIIIVEDELPARKLLKHLISRYNDFRIIAECANGFEGVKAINAQKPDLLLLDIQMPKLNGFEMLELLDDIPPVIFTTAYNEYAIKAFETNAVDYLLKPFDEERFDTALQKAFLRINDQQKTVVEQLVNTNFGQPLEQVAVSSGSEIQILQPDHIYLIEAQDDYVMIYSESDSYLKKKTMNFYEKHLDNNFMRVHRSYIINTKKIAKIELYAKQQYQIFLKNKLSVKTSKSGYKKIKQKFMQ